MVAGTHQGSVEVDHLQDYLDEFTFRFNRRRSRQRGQLFFRLLEHAVELDPIRFRDLVTNPTPKRTRPRPQAAGRRSRPATLARTVRPRPWRR